MKKIFSILLLICFVLCSISCSNNANVVSDNYLAKSNSKSSSFVALNESDLIDELNAFLGSGDDTRKDRTSFSEGEKRAATYIKNRLSDFGYEPIVQEFSTTVTISLLKEEETLHSQNVIAQYNPGKRKNVVIFAHYDNTYSSIDSIGLVGDKSEAIVNGATGVSVLLSLAKSFIKNAPALDYTINMVFVGASEVGRLGSTRFSNEWLKNTSDVLLAINLSSIATDTITIYADEVKTNHGELFIANGNGYDTKFQYLPKSVPLSTDIYATNIGYSHYGHYGDHVALFSKGVPCINFLSGSYDGLTYHYNGVDSLKDFTKKYPNAGVVMSDTNALIYNTLCNEDFVQTASTFREKFDYSFLMNKLVANIICIGLIIVLCVVLLLVVKLLSKKYPPMPKKQVKLSVFGVDYEDNNDNSVYVDIFTNDNNLSNEPFDFEKNNDKK